VHQDWGESIQERHFLLAILWSQDLYWSSVNLENQSQSCHPSKFKTVLVLAWPEVWISLPQPGDAEWREANQWTLPAEGQEEVLLRTSHRSHQNSVARSPVNTPWTPTGWDMFLEQRYHHSGNDWRPCWNVKLNRLKSNDRVPLHTIWKCLLLVLCFYELMNWMYQFWILFAFE